MKKSFLSFLVLWLVLMSFSTSASAQSESTTVDAGAFTQITDEAEIKKTEKLIKEEKKELEKTFKEDKLEFYEPGVFHYPDSKVTTVVYKIKSERVSINSQLSHAVFIVAEGSKNSVSSQLLKVENVEDGLQNVLMMQNGNITGDYIVRSTDNEFVSGWMTNAYGEKVDVTSPDFQESYEGYLNSSAASESGTSCSDVSALGIASFSDCLDRCLANSAVPTWLRYTIITAAGVSCVFGPNPVCLFALSQVAALWTSDAIHCVTTCTR